MQALYQMYNLQLRLDIKHTVDGGRVSVSAADVGGTVVFFNKSFRDIDSITVSAESTIERRIVYNFVDVPDPVSFTILMYDTSGVRVDGIASWKARGKL